MVALLARIETWIMLALGFSSGLPILLVYSTLSTWLYEAGVDVKVIGWFSLVGLTFGFKFLWAPLIDRLPCPWLSRRLGHRRGWLLAAQLALAVSLVQMGFLNPLTADAHAPIAPSFIYGALIIAISSATQDIVIDAVRVELAEPEIQAWLAGVYVAGYRVGMIVAGAGALFLATRLGSTQAQYSLGAWQGTYLVMAAFTLVGIATTFWTKEPRYTTPPEVHPHRDYGLVIGVFAAALTTFFVAYTGVLSTLGQSLDGLLLDSDATKFRRAVVGFISGSVRFFGAVGLAGLVGVTLARLPMAPKALLRASFVTPFADLLTRYGRATILIVLVIGTYRLTDVVMGVLANPFYIQTGFTKDEIATVTKLFGLVITIFGGFVGGWLTKRQGIYFGMWVGGLLAALTNVAFSWLANLGPQLYGLYVAIGVDNLAGGMASAAFVAFLSALTNRAFTATQYASLFALTAIFPKIVAAKSGEWVTLMGYSQFFAMTAVLGLPTLVFLWRLNVRRPDLMGSELPR
ncbi:MAG: MFS transporter [Myxococcota bacterium]|nr:MFS transporter [Myxococcota bacterium]